MWNGEVGGTMDVLSKRRDEGEEKEKEWSLQNDVH